MFQKLKQLVPMQQFLEVANKNGYEVFTSEEVASYGKDFIEKSLKGESNRGEFLKDVTPLMKSIVADENGNPVTMYYRKAIEGESLLKARSGVYADTPENRRLKRVGQKYGSDKQPEQEKEGKDKKGEDNQEQKKTNATPAEELKAVRKVLRGVKNGSIELPPEEVKKLKQKKSALKKQLKSEAESADTPKKESAEKRPEKTESNKKPEKTESKKEAEKPKEENSDLSSLNSAKRIAKVLEKNGIKVGRTKRDGKFQMATIGYDNLMSLTFNKEGNNGSGKLTLSIDDINDHKDLSNLTEKLKSAGLSVESISRENGLYNGKASFEIKNPSDLDKFMKIYKGAKSSGEVSNKSKHTLLDGDFNDYKDTNNLKKMLQDHGMQFKKVEDNANFTKVSFGPSGSFAIVRSKDKKSSDPQSFYLEVKNTGNLMASDVITALNGNKKLNKIGTNFLENGTKVLYSLKDVKSLESMIDVYKDLDYDRDN